MYVCDGKCEYVCDYEISVLVNAWDCRIPGLSLFFIASRFHIDNSVHMLVLV